MSQMMSASMQLPVLFHCEKQNMRLTTLGCAKLWRAAREKRPDPWDSKYHCFTCSIGAANAGEAISATAVETEAIRTICPRCRRRAFRMISGRFCISCYNRHREVLVGKNGKGGRPQLTDVLHSEHVMVLTGDGVYSKECEAVTCLPEAMIALARSAIGPIAFARAHMEAA
jgi:hypothetical protein